MTKKPNRSRHAARGRRLSFLLIGAVSGIAALMMLPSCQSLGEDAALSSPGGIPDQELDVAVTAKSGVQLWAEHCGRCHNVRDPASLSDTQWDVAMLHMRTRANLTADDSAAIRDFILTAN